MDIVFFFQSTSRSSWRAKLAGAYSYAREHDWFIHVIESSASAKDIRRAFQNWHPVGCLVDRAMGTGHAPDGLFDELPTVFLDRAGATGTSKHPCLIHDSAAEASLAGRELLRLGCRSYAYFGTAKPFFWDRERYGRFCRDVESEGLTVRELKRRGLAASLRKMPKPCGILAANDLCALEVHHAARSAGLSIPDDIAIAGIDNDEMLCESVSPGLTSAEPDFEGAGYRLAEMLSDEIERTKSKRKPHAHAKHYGLLRLVRRGSTAPTAARSPRVRRALEFIRLHAHERTLRIDAIAAEMGCSRRLATQEFRRQTGKSILDEILARRIARACEMLTTTVLPIKTITIHCGYGSDSFFKRRFREQTGMTMREWRKQKGRP